GEAQSGGDGAGPASLFGRAGAGVDENDDGIGGRGACDRVARVLHVSGAVGEDERATVGGEVPVGDVDGDALFAFGPQTVGEQSEVELSSEESAFPARRGDGGELVGEDRLRIVEESADKCRFAVVDGSGSGEAQQRLRRRVQRGGRLGGGCFGGGCSRHQKYPSFLRSSIAAAEIRSSARVAPRSVTVVAATSARMDSRSSALDSTAPVQLISPTVR